jgi:hypothetical protein
MNSPSTPLLIIKKIVYYLVRNMIKSYVFSTMVFLMPSLETSLLDFGLPHLKTLGLKSLNVGFNTRF